MTAHVQTPGGRPRARSLGVGLGGVPGRWNAITDVPGVEVGYTTLVRGEGELVVGEGPVRTGVTAIHPRGRGNPGEPVVAGSFALNGNGEMTGLAWVEESGTCALPITLTNTHAVGVAHAATVRWTAERFPELAQVWLLPVATETWDGYLNDINGAHVTIEVVHEALDGARSGPVEEGSVGGGTGMCCYGFKGGSGTASRLVAYADDTYTVGAFVQANFGARRELVVAGVPAGGMLLEDNPIEDTDWHAPAGAGSVVVIIATDAPLLPGQCKALARRVPLGLARTGTSGSHFSGDLFLALSTANPGAFTPATNDYGTLRFLPWGRIDPFYEAVVQAVEEAVLNALVASEEMTGADGRRLPALPHDRIRTLLG